MDIFNTLLERSYRK